MKDDSIYLIGLDLGTSAVKGVLVDNLGHTIKEAGTATSLLHPQEGWAEVDPEQHYKGVCGVLRELAAAAPGQVRAVAMAAASGNTLLTDTDGNPLANIISWMDRRTEKDIPAALVGLTEEEVMRVTGWPCTTIFPLAHLAWLREYQPKIYAGAAHVGMDTDWLMYKLTGRWVMDHSTATTFHLREQTTGTYYQPFLKRLEIPVGRLSELTRCGVPVGYMTPQAAADTGMSNRPMVVTGCFDHPSAARAMGVLEPGQLLLSCGTSWVGFIPGMDRMSILDAKLLCDPFLSATGGAWGGIFSVPYIGRTIDWYIENVIALGEKDPIAVFNESAARSRPGAGGLRIDLRETPHMIDADRCDISRAVMEGAVHLLNEKIQELRVQGFEYGKAVMVGGPAGSAVWPGIVEEITGLTVTVGDRSAGARGAAMLAGIGVGLYRDEEAALAVWTREVKDVK